MNILVLGATGFIGGHIARAALELGWNVRGLRRDPNSTGHLGDAPVEWIAGNLDHPASLENAMNDMEIVFHAAAYAPKSDQPRLVPQQIADAREQTQRVITAVKNRRVKRLIFTSTLSTIGQPPQDENRLADERDFYQLGTFPKNGYYECKIAMEEIVLQAAQDGVDAVILNPTAVFGPGDVHMSMDQLLLMIARGQGLVWLPGDINVIDARDVAQAHIQAVKRGRSGERYILGGHNMTVKEALITTARVCQVKPPRMEIPLWLVSVLISISDLFPALGLRSNHLRALPYWQGYNTAKARAELNLVSRPFEDTVYDTLLWFRETGTL